MHTEDFWRLMKTTYQRSGGDTGRQARLLISDLAALGPDEIIGYEKMFDCYVGQAYARQSSPDSAFSLACGFSDDSLEYFINAIIAAGQEVYDKVFNASGPNEIEGIQSSLGWGEEIGWVPRYAYYRATGQPHPAYDRGDYSEDDEYLFDDAPGSEVLPEAMVI